MGVTVSHCGLGPLYPYSEEGKRERKGEMKDQKGKTAEKEGETNSGLELEEKETGDYGKVANTAM